MILLLRVLEVHRDRSFVGAASRAIQLAARRPVSPSKQVLSLRECVPRFSSPKRYSSTSFDRTATSRSLALLRGRLSSLLLDEDLHHHCSCRSPNVYEASIANYSAPRSCPAILRRVDGWRCLTKCWAGSFSKGISFHTALIVPSSSPKLFRSRLIVLEVVGV